MSPCPKCQSGLQTDAIDAFPAEKCPGCGGLWLAREFLELWAQRQAADGGSGATSLNLDRHEPTPSPHKCPECAQPLVTLRTKGLQLEHCKQCQGIFLDPGELMAMARALASHAQTTSATATTGTPSPTSKPRDRSDGHGTNVAEAIGVGALELLLAVFFE